MSALGQKRTFAVQKECPLYPQKRTCAVQLGMSALPRKRINSVAAYLSATNACVGISRVSWKLNLSDPIANSRHGQNNSRICLATLAKLILINAFAQGRRPHGRRKFTASIGGQVD